jgi:5,10-methylenetetrahydromethanopterin reductase
MREKTLHLAGRVADGTILTSMSSPAYIHWALGHIQQGMEEAERVEHRVAVYLDVKVNPDGNAAREATRRSLAERLPWDSAQIEALGITSEVAAFLQKYTSTDKIARNLPNEWLDAFAAAGTPDQVAEGVRKIAEAGADTIIFQPLWGDPDCLDEYSRYLAPVHKILA